MEEVGSGWVARPSGTTVFEINTHSWIQGQKKSPPKEIFASEALALDYKKNTQDEDGDQ